VSAQAAAAFLEVPACAAAARLVHVDALAGCCWGALVYSCCRAQRAAVTRQHCSTRALVQCERVLV
jgi:hypothetical protein